MTSEQTPPSQPDSLAVVKLHRKQDGAHALEEQVARELARDFHREVIAMTGMTIVLNKPLASRAEQAAISQRFLALTSTPHGWWQQVLDENVPREERVNAWAVKARHWLEERKPAAGAPLL